MRCAVLVIPLRLFAVSVAADPRRAVYGTWGTQKQCAREPIKPGGKVVAEPFEINAEWLRHGSVWFQLNWFPAEQRATGGFTGAPARCGEDSLRSYHLGMEKSGRTLMLRWGVFRSNGPLVRCRQP